MHLDRHYRLQVEEALDAGRLDLVLYLDLCRYDETPMKVKHELQAHDLPGFAHSVSDVSQKPLDAGLTSASAMRSSSSSTSSMAKMFSTESKYCLLLRATTSSDADEAIDRYYLLQGTTLTWNQLLGAGTGACMARALLETNAVTNHSEQFFWKTRVSTTDAAATNILCEKILQSHRPNDWSLLHLFCNVHKASRAMTRSLELVEQHISGLVNFALSLQVGANMHDFRLALAAVVANKPLVIIRGEVPMEISNYQDFILETFGRTGTRIAERNFLLKGVCRGDWRRSDRLEVYAPPGLEVDVTLQKHLIEKALLMSVAHKNFSTFPKHRWLGADVSLDQIALACAVHNVGAEAFLVMCQSLQTKKPPSQIVAGKVAAEQPEDLDLHTEGSTEGLGLPGSSATPSRLQPMQAADDDSDDEVAAGGEQDWTRLAAKNARTRKKAANWVATFPLSSLIVLRMFMAPICLLLDAYISESGHKFEKKRLLEELLTKKGLQERSQAVGGLQGYIRQDKEQRFLEELQAALKSSHWQWMPAGAKMLDMQTLAFQLSSRLGALVYQMLIWPTMQCPFLTFKLLDEPNLASKICRLPQCLLDDFTKDFMQKYPGEKMTSQDARMSLHVIAAQAKTETVQLEWGHGRVHRLISTVSTQTHRPHVAYINSQWVCHKQSYLVSSWFRGRVAGPRPRHSKRKGQQVQGPARKKPRGWGGAFRAFISLSHKGQRGKVDFKQASQAFHQAREENTPLFQQAVQAGRLATDRQRAGQTGFGAKLRPLRRQALRARHTKLEARAVGLDALQVLPAQATEGPEQEVVLWKPDLDAMITQVRAVEREQQRKKAAKNKEDQALLDAFLHDAESGAVQELVDAVPELTEYAGAFRPLPQEVYTSVQIVADHQLAATGLASFAAGHSKTSNLGQVLSDDWKRKNRVIMDKVELQTGGKVPTKSACLEEGCCLCKGAGLNLKQLRAKVLQCFKRCCPKGSGEHRKLLADGGLVMRLKSNSLPSTEPTAWDLALQELLGDEQEEQEEQANRSFWFHVAAFSFRPYKPMLQELDEVEQEGEEVWLEQSGDFCQLVEILERLNLDLQWDLELHRIVSKKRPVLEFSPKHCLVAAWQVAERVWPLPHKRRGRSHSASAEASTDPQLGVLPHSSDKGAGDESAGAGGGSQAPTTPTPWTQRLHLKSPARATRTTSRQMVDWRPCYRSWSSNSTLNKKLGKLSRQTSQVQRMQSPRPKRLCLQMHKPLLRMTQPSRCQRPSIIQAKQPPAPLRLPQWCQAPQQGSQFQPS